MNNWQSTDYQLFPPQPTTDWTAAVLETAEQKPEQLAVTSKVSVGPASGDTPLQMRITQVAPGSQCSGVKQGGQPVADGQAEPAKRLTYAQTLTGANTTVQDGGRNDIKERWFFQKNLVRIQYALRVGSWNPCHGRLSVNAMAWDIGRQIDHYHRNLQDELATVLEPLERCLRVSVCLSTLLQKYNCPNNGVVFDYLTACFGPLFQQTFRPFIAAIKAQATAGNARDYFELLDFVLNFFQYYPDSAAPEGEGIRSEITSTLKSMIEIELDYLRYTQGFPRRGDDIRLISGLKDLLSARGVIRRLQLISDRSALAWLQRLQVLEHALRKPDPVSLNHPHKIDLLIARGDTKAASDVLAAHSGAYPFQERLVYEILKYECLKVVANNCQAISIEQGLAQLIGLNLFARSYRAFLGSHFSLKHEVLRGLLSDLVARMLTFHQTSIIHHEKRQELEALIAELAASEMLFDQCLSLWWAYRQSVLPVEESLAGVTSRDGLALFKSISERLSAKTCTDEDYQQSANEIRRWVKNEKIVPTMSQGPRLAMELKTLKHKLYLYFFQKIIIDGFVINKHDLADYWRVIEVMDQHREGCLRNQDLLFLLKDESHRYDWQQVACRAWGKLICTIRGKILQGQIVNEAELDDVLSLSKVSPFVEHDLTRIELKKLVIFVFKTAVCRPDMIRVSRYKLQRLAYWALAVIEAIPPTCVDLSWRNKAVRKRIAAYFELVRQQCKAANRTPPTLPREVARMLDGRSALKSQDHRANNFGRSGGEQTATSVYTEAASAPNQSVNSFRESLLDCLPLCIIKQDDYRRLEDSLMRISTVLFDILSRSATSYEDIAKKELDRIDLCLANLAPWFQNFCSQKESRKLSDKLIKLTRPDGGGNEIQQAFGRLIADRIQQGDIAGATSLICVQQGLYRVRTALGLPAIGQSAV